MGIDNLYLFIAAGLLHLLDGVISRHQIPTQSCVLTHVTNTLQAIELGAPVDLVFQSIGGTEACNRSFGVSLALLDEAHAAVLALKRSPVVGGGTANLMYFETGQGSALSAHAHHGVDQQTIEARAYAVARRYRPLLVNTVARSARGRPTRRRPRAHRDRALAGPWRP